MEITTKVKEEEDDSIATNKLANAFSHSALEMQESTIDLKRDNSINKKQPGRGFVVSRSKYEKTLSSDK